MSFALVRSKGPIRGDGHVLDAKTLRKGIPAAHILASLIEGALSGQIRQIDLATGEDIGPARPIPVDQQTKLQQYLLDKRLPTSRAEEVEEGPRVDLSAVPLTAEEIKRLPMSELTRVIEATFTENAEKKESSGDEPEPLTPSDP